MLVDRNSDTLPVDCLGSEAQFPEAFIHASSFSLCTRFFHLSGREVWFSVNLGSAAEVLTVQQQLVLIGTIC